MPLFMRLPHFLHCHHLVIPLNVHYYDLAVVTTAFQRIVGLPCTVQDACWWTFCSCIDLPLSLPLPHPPPPTCCVTLPPVAFPPDGRVGFLPRTAVVLPAPNPIPHHSGLNGRLATCSSRHYSAAASTLPATNRRRRCGRCIGADISPPVRFNNAFLVLVTTTYSAIPQVTLTDTC